MGGKRLIYAASLTAVVAVGALAAVSSGLQRRVPGWPVWATVLVGAAALLTAGLAKGSFDALSARLSQPLQRSGRQEEALAELGGRSERVDQVTGRLVLNIHPAIPLPHDADPNLSEEYPEYIPRDLDLGSAEVMAH